MADFGIGETAAASGAAKGAETAGAKGAESALAAGGGADVLAPVAGAAGAPLDLAAVGGLPTAAAAGAGDIVPATGALAGGLSLEPGFAGAGMAGADALGGLAGAGQFGQGAGADLSAASKLPGLSSLDSVAAGGTPSGGFGGPAGAAPVAAPAGVAGTPLDLSSAAATGGTDSLGGTAANGAAGIGGTPAAASGTQGGSAFSLDSMLKSAGSGIAKNPLGTALAAGGLGLNIYKGQQDAASVAALKDAAGRAEATGSQLAGQGAQYASYLAGGKLPPGLQAVVDQKVAAQKASITANYASRGLPTDPSKNSALASELAAADQNGVAMAGQLGGQLLQGGSSLISAGANYSGTDASLLKTVADIDQKQTQAVGQSIANFAAALGGASSKGLTVNLGAGNA